MSFVLSVMLFSACSAPAATSTTGGDDALAGGDTVTGDSVDSSTDQGATDPENYNWVIYVQDSSTLALGQMQMDFTINMKAVNTSGQIYGEYIGSATTKAVSHMDTAKGSVNAPMEGQSTSLVINVNPAVEDEDKLAPLTPEDPDDGKLAPLVPSDDDKLAPLTDPNNKLDYTGTGNMVLQSGGTGTVTARGVSVSKGLGNTSTNQLEVFIQGTTVRLAVTIPEVGTVYFDGYIIGEGKNG